MVENRVDGVECGGVVFGSASELRRGELCSSGVGAIWRGRAVCVLS
jgi:hypothetical protein